MAQGTFVQALRKEAALSGTFMKGRSLMLNGAVLSIEDSGSRFSKNVTVEGSVRGSRGDLYKTHVALDMDEHEVIDYDCDCPAAYRYPGMCKHAIATALAYLDSSGAEPVEGLRTPVRTFAAQPKQSARPAPTTPTVNPNFPFPAPVPTSPSLMAALSDLSDARMDELASMRRKLAGAVGPDAPKAALEPSLVPYYNPLFADRFSWALEFRIRCGSVSYVVKDIDGMADAYVRGGTFSYGKKLTFVHTPEAFEDVSTKLLSLVLTTVAYLDDITSSRSASYDFARSGFVAERQLPLSEHSIVYVLDLLRGQTISFEPAWSRGTTTHRTYDVAVEMPPEGEDEGLSKRPPLLAAKIAPAAGGSYDLRLPADAYCFASGDVAYLVDTRRARRTDVAFAQHAAPFLSRLLPCRTPVHIAADQVGEFCRMALPILRDYTDLTAPAALDTVAPEPSFAMAIGVDDGLVTCKITVTYGDWSADLFSLGAPGSPFEEQRPGVPPRDEVAEFRVMDTAALYFDFYEGGLAFEERDDESLFCLLTEGLSALSKLGEVMLSDRLHLDSYKRHQTFARLTSGDIIRLDEGARAAFGLAEDLGVDAVDLLDGVLLPASSTLFVDSMLARTPALEADRDAAFRRTVERLDTLGKMDFTVPATLKATLRGYQADGYQWLGSLEHLGLGGILADDMGLGKTLQMIAHILARVEAGDTKPTLVVCPASLVYNWTAELERFAPSLDVCAIVGAKAQRRVQIAGVAEHNVVVTSYDLMRRDIDEYAEQDFARAVLDEAQYIKNPLTQVARAAKRLPAGVRFALTGTPIENRLSELWSIFDFLIPGLLGTRESFAKRFESPVEHAEGDSAARLQALVSPFVLRRVKEDVVADLPEKIEDTVMAQLTGEQRKLYLANQDRIAQQVQHRESSEFKKDKLKVLAELTKLRQICCDPRLHYEDYKAGSAKLDTCMELVHGALDGGHRILLFSQFTGMLDIIGKRLAKEDIAFLKLTGASSKESRAKMVAQFQAGEVPVFLISLKAGGVGLNLTAADVVIHYDPWWNVAAQDQATDRAHRIGQQHTVTVYKLIAKDTIEERIMQMQESKRDLVNSVLGGDGISSALFTREDVLALLGGDGR